MNRSTGIGEIGIEGVDELRTAKTGEEGRLLAAYRELKSRIVSGEYIPSQRLPEIELAESLGISRATVRAVLVKLQNDGLVDIEANRGARVRVVTRDEALKMLDVREVLEGLMASLAAIRATDQHLSDLRDVLTSMEEAWRTEDFSGQTANNNRFHRIIVNAANHDVLERSLEALNFPLVRYRVRIGLLPGRKLKSLSEHQEIYDCLARRDPVGAEQAMRRHVAEVRSAISSAEAMILF